MHACQSRSIACLAPERRYKRRDVTIDRQGGLGMQEIGGSQDYVGDARNDAVLISVDGVLTPREEAKVSVFDSGFVLGDGVWEGLRLNHGRIHFLQKHFDRPWHRAQKPRIDISLS